jgi:hypothetical protein
VTGGASEKQTDNRNQSMRILKNTQLSSVHSHLQTVDGVVPSVQEDYSEPVTVL